MILDVNTVPADYWLNPNSQRFEVYVDGVPIKWVRYLDTDAGMVETLDLGDDQKWAAGPWFDRSKYPADWEIDVPKDGPVTRTIRGHVTVKEL